MPQPRRNRMQGLLRFSDGKWGVRCMHHGKQVKRKIGTEAEARAFYRELKDSERRGEVGLIREKKQTLAYWIDEYLKTPRNPTDQAYAQCWKQGVGHLFPEQFTWEALRDWAWGKHKGGTATSSIYRCMDSLRTVYADLVKKGVITVAQNPMGDRAKIGLPKPKKRFSYLKTGEVLAVRDALGPWWPYCEFAILTGMRFGNLSRLEWRHVDWDSRVAELHETKNGDQFFVQLSERALAILREQKKRDSNFCFPNLAGGQLNKDNFRRIWSKAFAKAGVPHLVWHDLRHTFATWLRQNKVSLPTIQALCDHADYGTTERYAHHSDEEGRQAVALLSSVMDAAMGYSKSTVDAANAISSNPLDAPSNPDRMGICSS